MHKNAHTYVHLSVEMIVWYDKVRHSYMQWAHACVHSRERYSCISIVPSKTSCFSLTLLRTVVSERHSLHVKIVTPGSAPSGQLYSPPNILGIQDIARKQYSANFSERIFPFPVRHDWSISTTQLCPLGCRADRLQSVTAAVAPGL